MPRWNVCVILPCGIYRFLMWLIFSSVWTWFDNGLVTWKVKVWKERQLIVIEIWNFLCVLIPSLCTSPPALQPTIPHPPSHHPSPSSPHPPSHHPSPSSPHPPALCKWGYAMYRYVNEVQLWWNIIWYSDMIIGMISIRFVEIGRA